MIKLWLLVTSRRCSFGYSTHKSSYFLINLITSMFHICRKNERDSSYLKVSPQIQLSADVQHSLRISLPFLRLLWFEQGVYPAAIPNQWIILGTYSENPGRLRTIVSSVSNYFHRNHFGNWRTRKEHSLLHRKYFYPWLHHYPRIFFTQKQVDKIKRDKGWIVSTRLNYRQVAQACAAKYLSAIAGFN